MSELATNAGARSSPDDASTLRAHPVETALVILLITFPILGTFFPPEGYFTGQSFSLQSVATTTESTFSSSTLAFAIMIAFLGYVSLHRLRALASCAIRAWPLLLLVLYSFMNSTWAAAPGIAFNRTTRMAVLFLMAVYVIERYSVAEIVRIFMISIFISAVLSIVIVFAAPSYGKSTLVSQGYVNAWRGAFKHKNSLGSWASVGLIFAVYSYITRAAPRITAPTIAMLGLLSIVAQSATASIATIFTAASAVYLSQFMRHRNPVARLLLVMIGIALASAVVIGANYFDDLIELVGRDPNLTGRKDVWAAVAIVIEQSPIWGQGQTFWMVPSPSLQGIFDSLQWAVPSAHSTWLDIWLQLGLVGLFIWIGACLVATKNIATLLLFANRREAVLWAALFLNCMFRCFTETALVVPGTPEMFIFTLACAGLAQLAESEFAPRRRAYARLRPV